MKFIKPLTIKKLTFSKKGIQTICFGAFLFGIILGAFVFLSIKTKLNFNILLFGLFNVPIWILLKPILKNEITTLKRVNTNSKKDYFK
jgi:hypothetical protein